jgi:hypothetical protein
VVEFALTDKLDVAIIVSLDRDLHEIPSAVTSLARHIGRPVRLEAAVPVPDGLRYPKTLPRFHWTHQITSAVFHGIRDDADYTVDDDQWAAPDPPEPTLKS